MAKYKITLEDPVSVAKALSDPQRVRALVALRQDELCLCQLTELLALASSTVSKHMSILKQAGLVATRKEARWMYFRLADTPLPHVAPVLHWILQYAADSPEIKADSKKLKSICQKPKEALCQNRQK